MDAKLSRIYYTPKGYWKGQTAITKLSTAAEISPEAAKKWLSKQVIWQIYLPAPRQINRPSFINIKPNDTHQIDLLYLPHDMIRRKRYKYALTVVDVASRYKDAEPLTEKSATATAVALQELYRRGPLKYPRLIQCDDGKEFKGTFNQLLLKHNVAIKRGIPGNHRSQALVENFNKLLSERLFAYQYHQEIKQRKQRNTEWVRRLPSVLRAMNSEVTKATGLKPVNAIKHKLIPQVTTTQRSQQRLIPFGQKLRYLYAPGEAEGDSRKRATDPIWSIDTYEIKKIVEMDPPIYYLTLPAPQRAFVKEELQLVHPDTAPL